MIEVEEVKAWYPEGFTWGSKPEYDEEIQEALDKGAILCAICGEPIYPGDTYYEIEIGKPWCWHCINDVSRTHWG